VAALERGRALAHTLSSLSQDAAAMVRTHRLASRSSLCLALLGTSLLASPAWAQPAATPSTEQMIEQLKRPPRTRGLTRNLNVERGPAAESPAAPSAMPAVTDAAASVPAAAAAIAAPAQTEVPAPIAAEQPASPPPPRPSLSLLIQFDFDSVQVRPESRQALANLAQALQSNELMSSRFAVEGHTDAKGSADYNIRLSQRRAEAVRDFLSSQGVGVARLQAAGKGATELANPAEPYAAENRRVRIVNLD
jgi:outer membrane protein OmpA-like peptidoglycan-associated protein